MKLSTYEKRYNFKVVERSHHLMAPHYPYYDAVESDIEDRIVIASGRTEELACKNAVATRKFFEN